jgi:hypothetical protein
MFLAHISYILIDKLIGRGTKVLSYRFTSSDLATLSSFQLGECMEQSLAKTLV